MTTSMKNATGAANTRRWPRYESHLPVLISFRNIFKRAVPGLASEISQSGMTFYGGASLQPGDVIEVEFRTPAKQRVTGTVRNRSGYCFGLEFLTPMTNGDAIANLQSGPDAESLPENSDEAKAPWRIWLAEHRSEVLIAILTVLVFIAARKAL
jgi:hypothetical protein